MARADDAASPRVTGGRQSHKPFEAARSRYRRLIEAMRPSEEERRPSPAAVPTRVLLARVARLLRPQARWMALVVPLTLASVGLSTVNPLIARALVDKAMFCGTACPKPGLSAVLLGFMVTAMLSSGVLGLAATFVNNTVGQNVTRDLRNRLYQHVTNQSMRFFSGTRTGEVQTRLLSDVGGVNHTLTEAWPNILQNVLATLGAIVAMSVMSLPLTAVGVIMAAPVVLPARWIGRIRRGIVRSTQQTSERMTVLTEETLSVSGALLTKVFGRQSAHIERFGRESDNLARLTRRNEVISRTLNLGMQTFYSLAPFGIYVTADVLLARHHGSLTVGTLLAFLGLQARLSSSFQGLVDVGVSVQTSLAYFERIYEYLDLAPEITDHPDAVTLRPSEVRGSISFDDVSFSYATSAGSPSGADAAASGGARHWALRGVDLEIAPGQVAALVGPSGAGKTTLSYLIARLYDPTTGVVRIDDHDVERIRLSSLSEAIGMVTQETYLLNASLRDNLAYARPDASEEEIVAAASSALLHERIMELPDGYESVVGERGYRLSGGERQRLALARVILKNPRILILDEATSSLDTRNERLIQQALAEIKKGRTTVVIAHRLSTIVSADLIFVVDRGQIVERGTHSELLGLGGVYAELYANYFASGAIEARNADGFVLAGGEVVTSQKPP